MLRGLSTREIDFEQAIIVAGGSVTVVAPTSHGWGAGGCRRDSCHNGDEDDEGERRQNEHKLGTV